MTDQAERLRRLRREPPPLAPVRLVERQVLSPRLLRLTFEGPGLCDFTVDEAAASIRLLVPEPDRALELPEWNGNEFLKPDGSRPLLRTFTPLRHDPALGRVDVEIVRHPGGAVSGWAESAEPGDEAAISGVGRGFTLPDGVARLLLLADETALPALAQLIRWHGGAVRIEAHVEVVSPEAVTPEAVTPEIEIDLGGPDLGGPEHRIAWHVASAEPPGGELVAALESVTEIADDTHVWAAGEASVMQRIRSHLFDARSLPRSQATVRGYWKPRRD